MEAVIGKTKVEVNRPNKTKPIGQRRRMYNNYECRIMGGSPGDVSEDPVMQEKQKKGWRMSCDVGEATEG